MLVSYRFDFVDYWQRETVSKKYDVIVEVNNDIHWRDVWKQETVDRLDCLVSDYGELYQQPSLPCIKVSLPDD